MTIAKGRLFVDLTRADVEVIAEALAWAMLDENDPPNDEQWPRADDIALALWKVHQVLGYGEPGGAMAVRKYYETQRLEMSKAPA